MKSESSIKLTVKELESIQKVRSAIRRKHYSLSTEKTYCGWITRYMVWLRGADRRLPSEKKVEAYLTSLAKGREISARTQDQALDALNFLYRHVLDQPLGNVNALRAKKNVHVRIAPSFKVTEKFLADVPNVYGYPTKLVAYLCYGAGLRVGEPLGLRIRDIDLEGSRLVLRGTKGKRDRIRPIPCNLVSGIKKQIEAARAVWNQAQQRGVPVKLPEGLGIKYPAAAYSFRWFWLFPMHKPSRDPRSQKLVWWHLLSSQVQKAFRVAAKKHGYEGEITPHVMRHAWATHEYARHGDLVAIKEGLGHKGLETTSIYLHASMDAGCPVEGMEIDV